MGMRLNILAEGDSWFAYPSDSIFFGKYTNVMQQFWEVHKDRILPYNIASNGDEARLMFNKKGINNLISIQKDSPYKVWLLSGGGNDIVGAGDMPLLLNHYSVGTSAADLINMANFTLVLDQITDAYRNLLSAVSGLKKTLQPVIVGHTYDFPYPDPRGAIFLRGLVKIDGGRSWIYPHMLDKGIRDAEIQRDIIVIMLQQFAVRMNLLAAEFPKLFFVAQTQGTIQTQDEWLNEIHLKEPGCRKIAKVIWDTMKAPVRARYNIKL